MADGATIALLASTFVSGVLGAGGLWRATRSDRTSAEGAARAATAMEKSAEIVALQQIVATLQSSEGAARADANQIRVELDTFRRAGVEAEARLRSERIASEDRLRTEIAQAQLGKLQCEAALTVAQRQNGVLTAELERLRSNGR